MENQAALRRDNGLFLQCLNCHIVVNAHTRRTENLKLLPEEPLGAQFYAILLILSVNTKKREEWREKVKIYLLEFKSNIEIRLSSAILS